MGLEYIELAPGFVREVVDVYDEVSRLYKRDVRPQESDQPKIRILRDTRLD